MTPDLDTMTGEELNRLYHELKGWTMRSMIDSGGDRMVVWVGPDGDETNYKWNLACLNTDANLLIAELDKTFLYEWSITRETPKIVECFGLQSAGPYDFRGLGTTVCEAGLRALIRFQQQPNKGVTITDAQAPTSGTRS